MEKVEATVAGSPEQTGSAQADSLWVDPDHSFLDDEEQEKKPETEVQQTEVETAEPVEQSVSRQSVPISREEQSFKDRYYALQDKYSALADRLDALESRREVSFDDAGHSEPEDIEVLTRQQWGDDPALIKMSREVKELKKELNQRKSYETKQISNKVYDMIESFTVKYKDALSDPNIGNKFVDEMNDRLGDVDFGQLVTMAQKGKGFDPDFVDKLSGKLERSYAAATQKWVDVGRKEKSDKRVQQRANVPVGATPAVKVDEDKKPTSYADAFRQTRYTGKK